MLDDITGVATIIGLAVLASLVLVACGGVLWLAGRILQDNAGSGFGNAVALVGVLLLGFLLGGEASLLVWLLALAALPVAIVVAFIVAESLPF